ncbi:DinB family protein [Jeotgalibacillus soli]|uniref:DNA damage-inducible protein DinB n=1 Tax=Jeotgalibacillus soli TaxID=889306 RepID=A0A0C2RGZ7_9BACL|nr:DinB family protein [Jeotgalibacillus soli]KIL49445.1 DNA damage-inducible protein DinB [Jeotgalibacillus soli]
MEKIDGFITSWLSHRKALLELLNTVDNEYLHYKPWDNAMSLSELVLHISGAMGMFVNTVKSGVFTPPPAPKSFETVEDLRTILQAETEQTITELESLTEEQLEQLVDFHGTKMPGIALLEGAKDHEIHHKGQLFTYARLTGAKELPFFVSSAK